MTKFPYQKVNRPRVPAQRDSVDVLPVPAGSVAVAEARPVQPPPQASQDVPDAIEQDGSYWALARAHGVYRNGKGWLVRKRGKAGTHTVLMSSGLPDPRGGRTDYMVERRVSLDWDEARRNSWDYYHPEFGWLLGGRKREVDATENLGGIDHLLEVVTTPPAQGV